MEQRSSITKWLFLGLAIVLALTYGRKALFGGDAPARQPDVVSSDRAIAPLRMRAPEQLCEIDGGRFRASLSTMGGSLRGYQLTETERYHDKAPLPDFPASIVATFKPEFGKSTGPIDLVTRNEIQRMPLRTDLSLPGEGPSQVAYDDLDYKLTTNDGKSCVFVYEERKVDQDIAALSAKLDKEEAEAVKATPAEAEAIRKRFAETFKTESDKLLAAAKENPAEAALQTRVTKTVTATGKPFELAVDLKIENLGPDARKHRLAVEQSAWRTAKEIEGSLGRKSDWMSETLASTAAKTTRQGPGDFEPGDFKDKDVTPEGWRRGEGEGKWAAVSSSYMTQIVLPEGGAPAAETLIEERWTQGGKFKPRDPADPGFGHIYRARLAYPEKELKQGESASYRVISFIGPKERDALEALGHGTSEVIDLGYFGFIGKVLIWYLYKLKSIVVYWGWAIVLMTVTVRLLLFPLSIAQIKSTAAMRRIKPEVDEINERYKDNTAQKGLALQELYKKHGINPVAGCLPMLLTMPVWFALYQALQTAVELYNVSFGPFIPDLSSPGKYFIIPAVLGASSFFQQKLMPMQGDPAQQKMMLYMMPTIFTVMMLFLPAGLGVYMLTNTWLGIFQQVMVERYYKRRAAEAGTGIVVKEKEGGKTSGDRDKRRQLLERGKARG